MKRFILIRFPETTYQVMTDTVVQHRAAYMHEHVTNEYPTLDDAVAGTTKLFEDENEIRDWAVNNMDWNDLASGAMILSTTPDRDFFGAAWSYSDAPSIPDTLNDGVIDDVPVGLILSNMIAKGGMCNVMLMGDNAAFVTILADQSVIGAYVSALEQLTEAVAKPHVPEQGRIITAH